MQQLKPGLHCRACDAPLTDTDDMELCSTCMSVVFDYNRDLLMSQNDEDDLDFLDLDIAMEEV